MTAEDISDAGYEAGEIHMDKLGNFSEEQVIMSVCEMAHDLVEQMEGTCEYEKYYSAYANVAANFMYGFGEGFGTSVNIIECEGDDGNAFGDDFLTEETINNISDR